MTAPDDALVAVPLIDLQRLIGQANARWLPLDRARDYGGLSVPSLRRLIASGKLTAHRPVKGRVLIDRFELDTLIGGATSTPRKGRGRGRFQEAQPSGPLDGTE
jgi:hypothetical protein